MKFAFATANLKIETLRMRRRFARVFRRSTYMTELRSDWLTGYYALGHDKFPAETISINNFSSERVDSKGLCGR